MVSHIALTNDQIILIGKAMQAKITTNKIDTETMAVDPTTKASHVTFVIQGSLSVAC